MLNRYGVQYNREESDKVDSLRYSVQKLFSQSVSYCTVHSLVYTSVLTTIKKKIGKERFEKILSLFFFYCLIEPFFKEVGICLEVKEQFCKETDTLIS